MRSPDNKDDIPPAKKAKLEEITPNPQDGTNDESCEHPKPVEYIVLVELEDIRAHRQSGEDMMSLYCKVMRDAGCPESKINPKHTSLNFFAELTPDEVKKLSDLHSVRRVTPRLDLRVYHEFSQPCQ